MGRKKFGQEEVLVPILFGELTTSIVKNMKKEVKILLNSGASGSIVKEQLVSRFKHVPSENCTWRTMAGSFTTTSKCVVEFILPKLNPTAKIKQKLHVVPKMSKYDIILGRDVMQKLGINLDFKDKVFIMEVYAIYSICFS